jgi:tetratricopeptide (TPR) repeat protein
MLSATHAVGRRLLVPGCILIGLAVVTTLVVRVQSGARRDLDRGLTALDADRPEEARQILDRYLSVWPDDPEVHFRAAQAARRLGDPTGAERHLERAAELGWDPVGIETERALIAAAAGNLRRVEPVLLARLASGGRDSSNILAVLVPAYAAEFRWAEAYTLTNQWIMARPADARAWAWRGEVCERRRLRNEAVDALRETIRLDPNDQQVRLQLARLLLEVRQTVEAAEHLKLLRSRRPDDPAVLLQLGICRDAEGASDEAAGLLDRVIAERPTDSVALYHRGRLELNRLRPEAAAAYLRRAVDVDPSDPEAMNSLVLALQQTGATEEARRVDERRKRAEEDLRRVAELARKIAAAPRDADLRREVGEIFLRNGRVQDGLRWLESALRQQPDHEPTHCLLADYYERVGRLDAAALHRQFCHKFEDAKGGGKH